MTERSEERQALAKRLAAAVGHRKLDVFLDSPDPRALVQSLPAEDLYFTVKELGLVDAYELVQLASATQFRTFVDLDCWRKDELETRGLLPWLAAAADEEDGMRDKIASLDVEVMELLFRDTTRIWLLEDDPDREPEGYGWRSPEGKYVVDIQADGEDLQTLLAVIDTYYKRNPLEAVRFLEATLWELPTELAELALQWRNGRLADLGFPEPEQAMKLYAYTDPDAPLPGIDPRPSERAGFMLAALGSQGFLDQALARLSADDLLAIDRELLGVFNGALVADRVDPGATDEVRKSLVQARDHLSLGLEYRSEGDAERAKELLMTAPISRLFQVASGLTLKRKFRADRLMKEGAGFPGAAGRCWFDTPLGEAVEALRRKRPQLSLGLESTQVGMRPFRTRTDLQRADEALADAEALASWSVKAGLVAADAEAAAKAARGGAFAEVKLSGLVLHLLVQGQGGAVEKLRALRVEELPTLLAWALTPEGNPSLALEEAIRTRVEGVATTDAERGVAHSLAAFVRQRAALELGPARQAGALLEPLAWEKGPLLVQP
jgi:hypothetical protein